jgi:hypothetical protein
MLITAGGIASIPRQTASVSALASAATVANMRPVTGAFTPDFEQRIYIDCMEDEARKYARLNETAAAIAASRISLTTIKML